MAKLLKIKLSKVARDMELQGWMWSWGFLGVGLGAFFAGYLSRYIFLILLIGVAAHIWSMYLVYINKK